MNSATTLGVRDLFLAAAVSAALSACGSPEPTDGYLSSLATEGAGCAAQCGDGVVDPAEACDDGNAVAGDGCEPNCTLTPAAPTCDSCRATNCRDTMGVDLVAGCFETVNTEFGATAGDPTFIQQCADIVACARIHDCAYDPATGPAACYCGSASVDGCAATGPAADAPCAAVWQAGARAASNSEVQVRFTDLAYPSGWAYFLLECDGTFCGDELEGDCTTAPAARCGNGVREALEACDDGNDVTGDGCSALCQVERCGDSVVQHDEACDDGNDVAGDGCESDCTVTPRGPTCESCRAAHCRDFQGVDLVAGCFEAVNGEFGADPADPAFIQQCTDIVACARRNDCAYDPAKGAAGCYCGTATVDACAATGPAADAPCVAEWQAGTRSAVNAEVQVRFTDLTYPAGWAYFLLECDTTHCSDEQTGDCTTP